jgi:predicted MFS family arabinose efflux permease
VEGLLRTAVPSDRSALRFVILVGVMSFFADFTYEGARSITGPYLAILGASGAVVGLVAGFGELAGYGLRLVSGRLADRTEKFWPIAITGYVVQMAAVPALALTGSWPAAAALIVAERIGKAIRNPPRDVLLSHAGEQMGGIGWAFGVHEALDQFGALFGPLLVALAFGASLRYHFAFAVLLVPALATLSVLAVARRSYPQPEHLAVHADESSPGRMPKAFWIYLAGAALVAAGFADFALVAYHFQHAGTVRGASVPLFYAAAMGASGVGSLIFGRLFDRFGLVILVPLTVVTTAFAPLVFLGGTSAALAGCVLWGIGMGVHESIMPAAVAPLVSRAHRASAYGLFTGVYGLAWFLGSTAIGFTYDRSVMGTVLLCVALQGLAVPFFVVAGRRVPRPVAS